IVDAVVQAFQQTASTAYLWLARRILNVHRTLAAEETESLQLATSMVSQISSAAMSFFQTTPFSEVPETTEDYFRLMERAVEALPGYILTMQSFPYVFQAAIAALEVNQFHAQMAVVHFWSQVLSPTRRHLRVMRENRSTTSMPASSSSPGHFPSPARTRRRSIRMDTYPVEQIVELCTKNGFELVFKLMQGLMQSFDREAISEATEIFASLAAIVSDGPTTLAGQFDSPPQATMMDWQQAVLAQVPDANLPPTDRQSLMGDLSNHIQGRQWARVKSLMSDFAAVFRRRNAGN
ncbi:Nuclear import receptor, partial [Linderina pennispora]